MRHNSVAPEGGVTISRLEDGKPLNEKGEEKEEREHLTVGENIYYAVIWLAVTGVMIYFITQIASQYHDAKKSPGTIITYTNISPFNMPQVTICNWNQLPPPNATTGDPPPPCDYCNLTAIQCWDIFSGGDCNIEYVQIADKRFGTFNCYIFNGNASNPVQGQEVGYGGSYSALFMVENPPEDDTLRIGLQVSLTPVGIQPDVFGEDKFAPPGLDSYYAVQSIYTVFNNDTPPTSSLRYDATYSTTAITRKNNDTNSFVSVSWAFQTLSVQQISYTPQYTLNNFFGDFAGMIGTLMGLDVIKVASGFYVAIIAWKQRNIFPLQDHFNG